MYLCYIILLQKLFPIYVQKVKGSKKSTSGKRSTSGKDQGEDAHGILEGISSLHSWIKTQTMIRPHPKGGRGGKQGAMYDEVIIFLGYCSKTALNSLYTRGQGFSKYCLH